MGRRAAALLAALVVVNACPAGAQTSEDTLLAERAAAWKLATTLFYEGVPYEQAAAVTPAGAQAVTELLDDPEERRHHGQALLILGIAGHPGAYEAIEAYVASAPQGEVDGADLRGMRLAPLAMGHLARVDDRALAWLSARALALPEDPGFGRGAMSGERLGRRMRADAVRGLGLSGRDEALPVLEAVRSLPDAGDDSLGETVERARALATTVRDHGQAAAASRHLPQ